ncbi:MAG: NAD(+) diphosphatase [Clostridiales bacterium]|jgi:NAD+ diphosphatase|nr:NAD(+) diphosphatase [Clostridiales bacterium]
MLHNIEPHKYSCNFAPRPPIYEQDYFLLFCGEQILLKQENEGVILPRLSDLPDIARREQELLYLFSIDDIVFWAYYPAIRIKERNNSDWKYLPIRNLREFDPPWLAFAAITGYHLYFWYDHNRYCGACGAKFGHSAAERALLCPDCDYLKYPEIAMAIIVGICDGDKLLLTRYAESHYKRYALIAGFVEIGESPEDALRREVFEEVGLLVKNIRYYASQPWGFSRSLLLGFFAEVDGSGEITLDTGELAEAVWVKREDISAETNLISLTATMMMAFKNNNLRNGDKNENK